jgi:hypothetical protein
MSSLAYGSRGGELRFPSLIPPSDTRQLTVGEQGQSPCSRHLAALTHFALEETSAQPGEAHEYV